MSTRGHVLKKREVEYGNSYFGVDVRAEICDWLSHNGVSTYSLGDYGENDVWEIEKESLRKIPESAYSEDDECVKVIAEKYYQHSDTMYAMAADKLRRMIADMIAAPTGEWSYVEWF